MKEKNDLKGKREHLQALTVGFAVLCKTLWVQRGIGGRLSRQAVVPRLIQTAVLRFIRLKDGGHGGVAWERGMEEERRREHKEEHIEVSNHLFILQLVRPFLM